MGAGLPRSRSRVRHAARDDGPAGQRQGRARVDDHRHETGRHRDDAAICGRPCRRACGRRAGRLRAESRFAQLRLGRSWTVCGGADGAAAGTAGDGRASAIRCERARSVCGSRASASPRPVDGARHVLVARCPNRQGPGWHLCERGRSRGHRRTAGNPAARAAVCRHHADARRGSRARRGVPAGGARDCLGRRPWGDPALRRWRSRGAERGQRDAGASIGRSARAPAGRPPSGDHEFFVRAVRQADDRVSGDGRRAHSDVVGAFPPPP